MEQLDNGKFVFRILIDFQKVFDTGHDIITQILHPDIVFSVALEE